MKTEEMLKSILELVQDLIKPIRRAANEAEKSNKSRRIILIGMLLIFGMTSIIQAVALVQLDKAATDVSRVAARIEGIVSDATMTKADYELTKKQLKALTDLAIKSAHKDNVQELERIRNITQNPSEADLQEVVQTLVRPEKQQIQLVRRILDIAGNTDDTDTDSIE